jgi:hypothetical protein
MTRSNLISIAQLTFNSTFLSGPKIQRRILSGKEHILKIRILSFLPSITAHTFILNDVNKVAGSLLKFTNVFMLRG